MAWGFEVILGLNGCNPDKLKDIEGVKNWVTKTLIPAIDMKAYGPFHSEHFAVHSHEAAGWSFMQFIETSSITGHLAENLGQAYINLFSCKFFNEEDVLNSAVEYFEADSYEKTFLERGQIHNFFKIVNPVIQKLCGSVGKVA